MKTRNTIFLTLTVSAICTGALFIPIPQQRPPVPNPASQATITLADTIASEGADDPIVPYEQPTDNDPIAPDAQKTPAEQQSVPSVEQPVFDEQPAVVEQPLRDDRIALEAHATSAERQPTSDEQSVPDDQPAVVEQPMHDDQSALDAHATSAEQSSPPKQRAPEAATAPESPSSMPQQHESYISSAVSDDPVPSPVDGYYDEKSVTEGPVFDRAALTERLVYPASAKRQGKEGLVVLRLFVSASGIVERVTIEQDPGYGFAAAAKKAFSGFACRPAAINGKAVPVTLRYPIRFVLK